MIEFIVNNKEWIFSGIGVTILIIIWSFTKFIVNPNNKKSANVNQNQKNYSNSNGTQIGIQNNYRGKSE